MAPLPTHNSSNSFIKDSDKLTLGQTLKMISPHAIDGVLKHPPDRWLTNARLTHYQALLLNPPRIQFTSSSALHPTTLLPDPDLDQLLHDSVDILSRLHRIRPDLRKHPSNEG